MKAHHRRPKLGEYTGSFGTEGRPRGTCCNRTSFDPELREVWGKQGPPGSLTLDVRLGLPMAEEVHVEWLCRLRANGAQFLSQGLKTERTQGREPSPPALETATARVRSCTPAMGA